MPTQALPIAQQSIPDMHGVGQKTIRCNRLWKRRVTNMTTNMNTIVAVIQSVMPDKGCQFSEEADLIVDLGFDSVNLLELISALERDFSLTFDDDDLEIERFQTPRAIAATLSKYHE